MANYQLKITIQATRLPDPIPEPAHDPGKDPMMAMAAAISEAAQTQMRAVPFYPGAFRESGLTLGKEIEIAAENFEELTKALGKFDDLAEQLECSAPPKRSW